ncbi:MAG: hypothetical protein A3D31_10010 [Candidatus Fluviicola riflensis]|nr:MAG: hypothetical protein CHH17_14425 [Candidatus Fluviicola riflensis]OGS78517.1 MAG: hypothetical protein A3D31_10010 [Candidatus Fluviicola riflensis]
MKNVVSGKKILKVPNLRFPGFVGEWEESLIGEILKIGSGKDYKHLSGGEIPVFGTGGYMASVSEHLFEGETVCIGRKGTINKPFYYHGKLWTVDTLFYTHSFERVLPRFVSYLFERINWLKYNEASGVPSLSKKTIEQIEIFIPSISEQKKLTDFHLRLDERIQTQNKIIQCLESLMRGLREKLFKQQIRFNNEFGNEFPNWVEKKIAEIALKKTSNVSANSLDENEGEYKIYGATGTFKNVDFYREKEEYISIVKDGAGVGRLLLCEAKSSVLGTLDIIKNNEFSNLKFLYYILGSVDFLKYKTGSTIPHIYFKDYSCEVVKFPSRNEQTLIANFLISIDEKINIEERISKNYEKQKKYLLQNLFI